MTLSGKLPVDDDLQDLSVTTTNQAALLCEVITELIGENWKHSFSGFPSDVTVDISYRRDMPQEEHQRNTFLFQKAETIFHELLSLPSHHGKTGNFVIRKEILEMLICIVKYKQTQRYASTGSYLERCSRPRLQCFAFQFLQAVLQLSPAPFVKIAREAVLSGIRMLQSRLLPEFQDVADECMDLSRKVYEFLSIALNCPLISSVFLSSDIRDLIDCAVTDIRYPTLEDAVLICLTVVVQTHPDKLKTENKDQVFSVVVAGLRFHLRSIPGRKLIGQELQIIERLFTMITAFLVATSVHIGVLNVCAALYHDGLASREVSLSIICRQGLQVLDALLRPRVPKEVFEKSSEHAQPLTTIFPVPGNSFFIQSKNTKSFTWKADEIGADLPVNQATRVVLKRRSEDPEVTQKKPKPADEAQACSSQISLATAVCCPAESEPTRESAEVKRVPSFTEQDAGETKKNVTDEIGSPTMPSAVRDDTEVDDQVQQLLSLFNDSGPDGLP